MHTEGRLRLCTKENPEKNSAGAGGQPPGRPARGGAARGEAARGGGRQRSQPTSSASPLRCGAPGAAAPAGRSPLPKWPQTRCSSAPRTALPGRRGGLQGWRRQEATGEVCGGTGQQQQARGGRAASQCSRLREVGAGQRLRRVPRPAREPNNSCVTAASSLAAAALDQATQPHILSTHLPVRTPSQTAPPLGPSCRCTTAGRRQAGQQGREAVSSGSIQLATRLSRQGSAAGPCGVSTPTVPNLSRLCPAPLVSPPPLPPSLTPTPSPTPTPLTVMLCWWRAMTFATSASSPGLSSHCMMSQVVCRPSQSVGAARGTSPLSPGAARPLLTASAACWRKNLAILWRAVRVCGGRKGRGWRAVGGDTAGRRQACTALRSTAPLGLPSHPLPNHQTLATANHQPPPTCAQSSHCWCRLMMVALMGPR